MMSLISVPVLQFSGTLSERRAGKGRMANRSRDWRTPDDSMNDESVPAQPRWPPSRPPSRSPQPLSSPTPRTPSSTKPGCKRRDFKGPPSLKGKVGQESMSAELAFRAKGSGVPLALRGRVEVRGGEGLRIGRAEVGRLPSASASRLIEVEFGSRRSARGGGVDPVGWTVHGLRIQAA